MITTDLTSGRCPHEWTTLTLRRTRGRVVGAPLLLACDVQFLLALALVALPIPGLVFEANTTTVLDRRDGWFSLKLGSSPGPMISDYITHEAGFQCRTYGIHVGQDDRLTFLG